MIKIFLNAKPWVLFILMFGIMFIYGQVFQGISFKMFENQEYMEQLAEGIDFTDDDNPFTIMFSVLGIMFNALLIPIVIYGIISIFSTAIYYCWMWSVVIGLQSKLPQHTVMCIPLFKFSLFFSIACFPLVIIGIIICYQYDYFNAIIIYLMISATLFSIFCAFYIIYFAAKTYKTAELQRPTRTDDYIGEFFAFWFYFIGVWIVQPKIIKMVNETTETSN